jgi:tetratricopeptide (TPR) repeat protein
VDRDPSSARAWTGLADAYAVLALNYWGPPGDYYARAKGAALRAVELDSTIAEAHASLATVSFLYDRNWAAAERAFRRAIDIDPDYPTAHYFYSIFLSGRLRDTEAVEEARRAKELDPLSPPLSQGVGMVHVLASRPAEAIPLLREATTTFPEYYFPYAWLGLALARAGQPDEGIAAGRRALALAPDNVLVEAFLGMTLAAAGHRDEALQIAERIAARPGAIPFTYLARIYAGAGDKDKAFAWLARAVRAHEGQVAAMLTAGFENIASDPRFGAIARQAGVKDVSYAPALHARSPEVPNHPIGDPDAQRHSAGHRSVDQPGVRAKGTGCRAERRWTRQRMWNPVRSGPSFAQAVIDGWIAAGDTMKIRQHAWDIWAALTGPSGKGTRRSGRRSIPGTRSSSSTAPDAPEPSVIRAISRFRGRMCMSGGRPSCATRSRWMRTSGERRSTASRAARGST